MFWAIVYLVLWIIGGLYGGSVIYRADVAGRPWGGPWGIGWILFGIIGWEMFGKFMR